MRFVSLITVFILLVMAPLVPVEASHAGGVDPGCGPMAEVEEGLLVHWDFNETNGTVLHDVSGNGHHGTVHGGTWTQGVLGGGLSLDGVDDRIQVPEKLVKGLILTFNAWIKTTDDDFGIISGANAQNENEYAVYVADYSNYNLGVYYHDNNLPTNVDINDGKWHMSTVVTYRDRTRIYLDGNFVENHNTGPGTNLLVEGLWLGTDQDSVNGSFEQEDHLLGVMDEICIWDRALNDTEINRTFLASIGEAPVWRNIPTTLDAVEDVPLTHDFSGNVYDPDTPLSVLLITSTSPYVTLIQGLNVTFEFPNGVLTASVPLVLSDAYYKVQLMVNFTVQPVNDPPGHNITYKQEAREDKPWSFNLTRFIWDIDNDMEELVLLTDSPYATFEGLVLTMLFPEPIGEYDLWFNISDGTNATEVHLHFTIIPAPTAPSEPTDLKATAGDGMIELEWRAPREDGDSPVLGYRVFRGLSVDSLTLVGEVDAVTIRFSDGDLTNGVTYCYAVLCFNAVGDSELNVIHAMPVGPPGAPRAFAVTPGNGSVTLTWEPPEHDGGEPIGGYWVMRGSNKGSLEFLANASNTNYIDLGVENGEVYFYQVRAETNASVGPGTMILEAMPIGPPSAPRMSTITPKLHGVHITWDVPFDDGGSPLTGYRIYRGESRDDMHVHDNVSAFVAEYLDTDVVPGIEYHYQVAALNGFYEGERSWYNTGFAWGLPSSPTDLNLTPGDALVELRWGPPEDDGGPPIIGYMINRGTEPGTLPELALLDAVTSYVDDTAENDVTYYYAIAAVNEEGYGEFAWSGGVTPHSTAVEPGEVRLGNIVAKKKEVTLVWTAPADDGGSPITGYVIYRGTSEDDLEVIAEIGPDTLTWSDEDVGQGKTYWYTVVPENDVGEGEPAAPYRVKVPKDEESPAFSCMWAIVTLLVLTGLITRRHRA